MNINVVEGEVVVQSIICKKLAQLVGKTSFFVDAIV
jgi:hypothetical protein